MRRLLSTLVLVMVVALTAAHAEERIEQVSVFQDGWGNTGSFWQVKLGDKEYLVLKLIEKDKKGEADFVFDRKLFNQFENNFKKLKRTSNKLKSDGFEIGEKILNGDALVQNVYARMNGVKFKAIQVHQTKEGHKYEHSLAISKTSTNGLRLGIRKARRVMGWQ